MPEGPRLPAFFLADFPTPGNTAPQGPRLSQEDARHALKVLRMRPGDRLVGLDGRGNRVPLQVRAVHGRVLELEATGPSESAPAPGAPGSSLPWFEVAVAWPRRTRVEDMVARLVQLGAAAIRPLAARRRGPADVPERTSTRLQRVVREACKQCGRLWLPELEEPLSPEELVRLHSDSPLAALDPEATLSLDTWLRSLRPTPEGVGTRARPIVLAIGPEGGWEPEEREALLEAGKGLLWLGPHVLRVETAAEAAMAIAGVVHGSR